MEKKKKWLGKSRVRLVENKNEVVEKNVYLVKVRVQIKY